MRRGIMREREKEREEEREKSGDDCGVDIDEDHTHASSHASARRDNATPRPYSTYHLEHAAHALVLLLDRVEHGGASGEDARVDAGEGEGTNERVGGDLEGKGGERLVVARFALHLLLAGDVWWVGCAEVRSGSGSRCGAVRRDSVGTRCGRSVVVGGGALSPVPFMASTSVGAGM